MNSTDLDRIANAIYTLDGAVRFTGLLILFGLVLVAVAVMYYGSGKPR